MAPQRVAPKYFAPIEPLTKSRARLTSMRNVSTKDRGPTRAPRAKNEMVQDGGSDDERRVRQERNKDTAKAPPA